MRQLLLFSQNKDAMISFFDEFNKEAINNEIVKALKEDPTDTIEYCRKDLKKFAGVEIIAFFEVNPKNKKVSKCILRGDKTYYKSIEK